MYKKTIQNLAGALELNRMVKVNIILDSDENRCKDIERLKEELLFDTETQLDKKIKNLVSIYKKKEEENKNKEIYHPLTDIIYTDIVLAKAANFNLAKKAQKISTEDDNGVPIPITGVIFSYYIFEKGICLNCGEKHDTQSPFHSDRCKKAFRASKVGNALFTGLIDK